MTKPLQVSDGLRAKVAEIIQELRPAVQGDGGDLELVGVDEGGVVRVRLHGACIGCPSAAITLRLGVEQTLKDRIPEVTRVVCV
ncbi:MAG: NifU family protein [Phycisphaerae bacterium]